MKGLIAKRADSTYQAGKRSGDWTKYRLSLAQEFVVGGYTPSDLGIDALIIGFYEDSQLKYASRVRAGFVPVTRRRVLEQLRHLKTDRCPFANLPEKTAGRWGQGLTADKMKECIWLKPKAVAWIEFQEWTDAIHLRNTKFVALRDDKDPKGVVRET